MTQGDDKVVRVRARGAVVEGDGIAAARTRVGDVDAGAEVRDAGAGDGERLQAVAGDVAAVRAAPGLPGAQGEREDVVLLTMATCSPVPRTRSSVLPDTPNVAGARRVFQKLEPRPRLAHARSTPLLATSRLAAVSRCICQKSGSCAHGAFSRAWSPSIRVSHRPPRTAIEVPPLELEQRLGYYADLVAWRDSKQRGCGV